MLKKYKYCKHTIGKENKTMGYYADGYGSIVAKGDHDTILDHITEVFGTWDKAGSPIKGSKDTYEFTVFYEGKYYSDEIYEMLNELKPVEASIDFIGEDNSFWSIRYDHDRGVYEEEGEILYDNEDLYILFDDDEIVGVYRYADTVEKMLRDRACNRVYKTGLHLY